MKNVRVVFNDVKLYDPLAACPTVGVKAEIGGKEYGDYVEFSHEPRPEEVCSVIQGLLDMLQKLEERMNYEDQEN